MAAATWVWRHNEEAGPGTETLPGGEWFYVPLATARGVVGVVGVRTPKDRGMLSIEQRELLQSVARQAAIAIERCRIDVVLEEQAKTEQIIEASEDGIIVLDPSGVVIHVNEVACAILEMDRAEVVGRRFENLEARHTHYLRLREAVRDFLEHPKQERERLEISLFLRGRDHYYVLRPTPFHTRDGTPAGVILALQDITYVRDQERAARESRRHAFARARHPAHLAAHGRRDAHAASRQGRSGARGPSWTSPTRTCSGSPTCRSGSSTSPARAP